jgi:hypothetical protein
VTITRNSPQAIYQHPGAGPHRHLDIIAAAYRTAGLDSPNRVTEALTAARQEPGADDVAHQLATEAYAAQDANLWLDDALARIQRAMAADALRAAIALVEPNVRRTQLPAIVDQAVSDLAKPFARTAKALTSAAAKLDKTAPLDLNNAVRDDTTKELKQAHQSLNELSAYAGIHLTREHTSLPPALARVIPIVDLPRCEVEVVADSFSDVKQAINGHQCTTTYIVRDLTKALERNTDAALLAVARGDFTGVSLSLGNRAEVQERVANAVRSNSRRKATAEDRANQRVAVAR